MLVFAVIRFIIGLAFTFCGYRYIRHSIIATGFFFGMLIANFSFRKLAWNGEYELVAILGIVIGIAVSSLLVWLQPLGMFAIGVLAGGMAGYLTSYSVGYDLYLMPIPIFFICGFGLVVGVLAAVLKRPFVTFALSWIGAVCTMSAIGEFAGGYPTPNRREEGGPIFTPSGWWYYLVAIVVLCSFGMAVQFFDFTRTERLNQSNQAEVPVDEKAISQV